VLVISGFLAGGLAVVHFFCGRLCALPAVLRGRLLSLAGGIAVAYVFVNILPELNERQQALGRAGWTVAEALDHPIYLFALAGLAVFYGLERAVVVSSRQKGEAATTERWDFWLHIAAFSLYNALIGYLLVDKQDLGVQGLLFFGMAMALHLVVNDNALRQHHEEHYGRLGRWVLALAVLMGWGLGVVVRLDEAVLAVLFALLAGGIVLNVFKEELPEERESCFGSFTLGAGGYAVLLLVF
jgi:hypothetical protein